MTQPKVIHFVTGNMGKVKSMQEHLSNFDLEIVQTKLSFNLYSICGLVEKRDLVPRYVPRY